MSRVAGLSNFVMLGGAMG